MAVAEGDFLSVRAAARMLEVHENTIRNWVKEGRLADARVPGSRFLRVERSAVQRMRDQRGKAVPSLKAERLNANPELANAGQLRRWALDSSKDAQQHLPEMVRRLLAESPGVSGVSVRTGDGVALSGWDGLADSDGSTAFLPPGQLRFEIGIEKSPQAKAEADYAKRVAEEPAGKVFVFVTPHRWAGKEEWATAKRRQRAFSDVRVLDADDLEGWLKLAPATHYWISEHLGLSPRHAQTLEARWNRFSSAHEPPLPAALFTAGRDAQVEQLRSRLASPAPQLTTIQAEWVNDCLGFLHGAVAHTAEQRPGLDVPILLIDSEEVWERVIDQAGESVLVPMFAGADVGRALDNRHHVVSLVDKTVASRRAIDIALPRPSRPGAGEALEAAGLEFRQAQQLAALARRSMPAMARKLSRNPTFARPTWANAPDGLVYVLLVLVGAWTPEANDRKALELLTGRPLGDIDRLVESATDTADALFRQTGETVMVASPEEAFSLLKEALPAANLERWLKAAEQVLFEPDPVLDLPTDERHLAGMKGLRRRYSGTMTRGIAQGIALCGAMGEESMLSNQRTVAEMTADAVGALLRSALSDRSGRQLHLVAASLPLLAEAAPNEFLAAMASSLDDADPVILTLFQEVDDPLSLGPSSPHPHLLWALETLCWSQDHLVESVRILAGLAARESNGRSGNRPSSSLANVLAGWVRHTAADLESRIRAVDAVLETDAEVGWTLLRGLWPEDHAWSMPPASPRFRENWTPSQPTVPMREWVEFVSQIVSRAIDHADASSIHLPELVDMISTVPPESRDRVIAHLESVAASTGLDQVARSRLWEQLQTTVLRHRRFDTAAWAMEAATLTRLKALADAIEPSSDLSRLAYLFDWHPDLPDADLSDFDRYQVLLEESRTDAVRQILRRQDWIDSLAAMVRKVKAPSQLAGSIAGEYQVTSEVLIAWLAGDASNLREVAFHVFQRRIDAEGPEYLSSLLNDYELSPDVRASILLAIPPRRPFWEVLQNSNPDDYESYWRTTVINVVAVGDSAEAIAELSARGRAWMALAVASFALTQSARNSDQLEAGLSATNVMDLLNAALAQRPLDGELGQMTSHYVGELIDFLAAAGVDESVIAQFEFKFFRLLKYSREPATLSRLLASDPKLFVDLVQLAFRAKSEPRRDRSTDESNLASHAYSVLNSWKGYPGRMADDQVDPVLLDDWIVAARLLLSEADRADIGDEVIGESFAHSPLGSDGAWPAEPVRDAIERIGSPELENGFIIGRLNSRGVTSRGVYDGGQQERDLAARFRTWSVTTSGKWPRTSRILRSISDRYERDARREDLEAELDADRD